MTKKDQCPYCKSRLFVYRGYRYNEKTKKHLRLCKKCKRKFTPRDVFFRMRYSPQEIKEAVRLYGKGMSLAEVRQRMEREDVKVSRWTILKWYRKYKSHKV